MTDCVTDDHPHTVNCTIPDQPVNGTIVYLTDSGVVGYNVLNETLVEGTVLTYECDNNLSLTGPNTITCTNAGVWSTDPREIMCVTTTVGESVTLLPIAQQCRILYNAVHRTL